MEKVSFKVSFTKQDQISQVRRFEVPQDCSTSYLYLKEKLRSIFSDELGTSSGLNITWQDHDEDIVSMDSDEELIIAMHELKGPVYKFNVSSTIKTSSNDQGKKDILEVKKFILVSFVMAAKEELLDLGTNV